MRKIVLLVTLLELVFRHAPGQCVSSDFTIPSVVCSRENIVPQITIPPNATSKWDFCTGDLLTTPTANLVGDPISSVGTLTGVEAVEDNGNHFLFLTGRTTNNLVRVALGANMKNATPLITNLGSFGGVLNGPVGLKFLKENSIWYCLVYNSGDDKLIRLTFGSSLSNVPSSAVAVITAQGGANNGLELAVDNGNVVCLITQPATGKLTLINFGSSITNTPSETTDVLSTATIVGSNNMRGISLLEVCGAWHGFVANSSNNKILRLDFGTNLFSIPAVTDVTGSNTSADNFVDIKIFNEGGVFVGFLMSVQGKLYRLDFGNTITSNPSFTNLGTLSVLSDNLYFDFHYTNSTWSFFAGSYSSAQIYRGDFLNNCGTSQPLINENQPTVSYNQSGSYKVSLFVNLPSGESNTITKSITVNSSLSPVATIGIQNSCVGNDVNFTSLVTSGSVTSYDWSFGDLLHSALSNATHQYDNAGDYAVELTLTDANLCQNVLKQSIRIYDPPVASFDLPSGLLCTNNEFIFTNTTSDNFDGLLAYQWSVDNSVKSTSQDFAFRFLTTGVKTIKLVSKIPGCSHSVEVQTQSVQAGPSIDFTFSGQCVGSQIAFVSQLPNEISNYSWIFPGSVNVHEPSTVFTFSDPGNFAVSLTATSLNGCVTVETRNVTIFAVPVPDFNVQSPGLSCTGSATTFLNTTPSLHDSNITLWRWNFGDVNSSSNNSNDKSPTHTFATLGDYSVQLKAKTDKGCESMITKTISVLQSPGADFLRTATCVNVPANFTSSGNDIKTYYWEIGTSYYLAKTITHTFTGTGQQNVKLTVTGNNNCISSSTKNITVPMPLLPSILPWKTCVGYEAEFTDNTTGSDPVAWRQWNIGGIISENVKTAKFAASKAEPLPVILTVRGESGCTYSKVIDVNISKAPVAKFTMTPLSGAIPLKVETDNLSVEASKFKWSFNDGTVTNSNDAEPSYSFTTIGVHSIELKASNEVGCESISSKTIDAQTPAPDAEIKLITLSQNPDKTLKIILTIQNNGNTIITDLPVKIDLSGELLLTETVKGPLIPNEQYNLVLSYGIAKSRDLRFLCAQTELTNDMSTLGNRSCVQFDKEPLIMTPYPNPATDVLNIEWMSTSGQKVSVMISDGFGKALLQQEIDSSEGLNQHLFDVHQLKAGIYFLVINDGLTIQTQRILISPKN
jgi:PKD repeat protein